MTGSRALNDLEIVVMDTSVLIDHLRGHLPATALLQVMARSDERRVIGPGERGPLVASELTRFEVLATSVDGSEANPAVALIEAFDWIPITGEISEIAAGFARKYRYGHSPVSPADCLIAATAVALGGTVASATVDNFPMFPGLEPAYGRG